jgi:DNA-binding sugar fermentation-stimulating protein
MHLLKDNSKIIPMLVFIIQRDDCYGFTPNFEKDPLYSNELKKAYELGLTVKAVMLKMSPKNVKYVKEVPVIL